MRRAVLLTVVGAVLLALAAGGWAFFTTAPAQAQDSTAQCARPTAGLVSQWKGEGNANDSAGSNNGTLVNGTTFAAGKVGQAFSFDGSNDYINIPDPPENTSLNLDYITIEMWLKPNSSGNDFVYDKRNPSGFTGEYDMLLRSSGTFQSTVFAASQVSLLESSSAVIPMNTWTHYAAIWDGQALKIYLNGNLVLSKTGSGAIAKNSQPLRFGTRSDLSNEKYRGLMDEMAIYNRALSQQEIQAIYCGGNPPSDTTAPDAPNVNLDTASDTGSSDTDGITNDDTPTFTGTAEPGSTVKIYDGDTLLGQAVADSSGHWSFTVTDPLGDGEHSITVTATDGVGNTSARSAPLVVTIDTAAREITVTDGPSGTINGRSVRIEFSSEDGSTFECRLNDEEFAPCSSPVVYDDLPDGDYVFEIRSTDPAGNVGSVLILNWIINATGPTTTIIGGPSKVTNETSITFNFSSEEGATYECSLNGEEFTACGPSVTYTDLEDGDHVLRVRAVDEAGNRGPVVIYEWTIDTVRPGTTFSEGPSGTVNTSSVTFEFFSETGATFRCRLNGTQFVDCDSPITYDGLTDGTYTFYVQAMDAAGNEGSVIERTFRIDTTGPETTIVGGPSEVVNTKSVTFNLSSEEEATFLCRLNGGEFVACGPSVNYEDLEDASYTLEVVAVDEVGNTGPVVVRRWIVDTVAPETAMDSGPSGAVNTSSATFEFSSEEGSTFECRLNDEEFRDCESSVTYEDLDDGEFTFEVRAIDAAGTLGLTVIRRWKVDTVGPETTVIDGPSEVTNETSVTFNFSSEEEATYECSLDGEEFVGCGSTVNYEDLGDGDHVFKVRAVDEAGNRGAVVVYEWTVDTVPPGAPAIENSASYVGTSFTISGTAEPGSVLELFEDGEPRTSIEADTSGGWSIELDEISEGSHTYKARATDAAGNTSIFSEEWTVAIDGTPPEVSISSGPSGPTNDDTPTFGFGGTDDRTESGDLLFSYRLDDRGWSEYSNDTSVTLGGETGLDEGPHTLYVRARDLAGNVTEEPAEISFTIDTTEPTIDCVIDDDIWHEDDASIACTASDDTTDLANPDDAQFYLSTSVPDGTETDNASTNTREVCDAAGNCATAGPITGIKVDKKAPELSCSVNPKVLWPPNHKLVPVDTSITVRDGGSGSAGFALTSATSDEPDDGLGDGDTPNDIQDFVIGTPDTSGELRAERGGPGHDRVYTLSYKGTDVTGNSGNCSVTVTVRHDQRR